MIYEAFDEAVNKYETDPETGERRLIVLPVTADHLGCMRRRHIKSWRTPGRGTHIEACPRTSVAELQRRGIHIPTVMIESLEENQKLNSCCRHPENHTLTAHYTSEHWKNKQTHDGYYDPNGGVPDVYIFQCTCGRIHPRMMAGIDAYRPTWGMQ